MFPIEGLSGPFWIGGKLLIYLKPIIVNGTHCELVEWTSKDFEPNGVYSSPTKVKGQKNQVECVQTSIEQAFIKIKDNYTLPTHGLPLIWLAYLWFHFWYFTHLWFPPLLIRNPPPVQTLLKHLNLSKIEPKTDQTLLTPKTHSHPTCSLN